MNIPGFLGILRASCKRRQKKFCIGISIDFEFQVHAHVLLMMVRHYKFYFPQVSALDRYIELQCALKAIC